MIFDSVFSYWFVIGCVYLFVLSVQDIRDRMVVDARWNYVMVGLSLSLWSHVSYGLWFMLGLVLISVLLAVGLSKSGLFGRADIVAFAWIFWGLGIIHIFGLIAFFLLLLLLGGIGKLTAKFFDRKVFPFMPVIFSSFLLSIILLEIMF